MNGNGNGNGNSSFDRWRRLLMFLVGATILILELEWHDHVRFYVIGLALVLMGIVTFEQAREYFTRSGPTLPAKKPPD